jgi:hypothetical protein
MMKIRSRCCDDWSDGRAYPRRRAGVSLVINDTTEINFRYNRQLSDVGRVGSHQASSPLTAPSAPTWQVIIRNEVESDMAAAAAEITPYRRIRRNG